MAQFYQGKNRNAIEAALGTAARMTAEQSHKDWLYVFRQTASPEEARAPRPKSCILTAYNKAKIRFQEDINQSWEELTSYYQEYLMQQQLKYLIRLLPVWAYVSTVLWPQNMQLSMAIRQENIITLLSERIHDIWMQEQPASRRQFTTCLYPIQLPPPNKKRTVPLLQAA